MSNKELIINNLRDLLKEKKFKDIMLEGIKLIKPSKNRIITIIIILLIMIKPSIDIVRSSETIERIISILEFSNDITKDLFGVVFTGYALFQALIGANSLKQMLINKIGEYSSFKAYNLYFFIISIIYLGVILLNYFLLIIFKNVNFDFINRLTSVEFKNIMGCVFIMGYIGINTFAISEIKSFLVNMYHCFNLSVFSEGIEMVKNISEEDSNK